MLRVPDADSDGVGVGGGVGVGVGVGVGDVRDEAEVPDLDASVGREQYVAGLQVAVDEPRQVHVLHRAHYLAEQVLCLQYSLLISS